MKTDILAANFQIKKLNKCMATMIHNKDAANLLTTYSF